MTQFDLIVFALLAISAAVGFARGAMREIAALVAPGPGQPLRTQDGAS